jgi:hypothetical protein
MLQAQTIPVERSIDWQKSGCNFVFPFNWIQVSVADFGAIPNDSNDDIAAFQAAITSLPASGGIIFIPAGIWDLSATLTLPDSIILQGAGTDSVLLLINHSNNGISVNGSAISPFYPITNGYTKGSFFIICDSAHLFIAGDNVEIHQTNGNWDISPATWATYSVGQINRVLSVSGDSIFLEDALNISYENVLNPEIRRINSTNCVSMGCFSMERTEANIAGTSYNISFNFAHNCRVHGIGSNKSQGSHVMIAASSHISIERCYFHDAYMYDGTGTKGYGVTLNNHATLCRIENNIFNHLRHAMMTKHGANGNVFGYNYSTNPYRNGDFEFPSDYCGDISLHGHFSFANLFEGNVVQNIMIDDYWGPSGPYNTFFRNKIEYYGFIMSSATTDTSNIVGNEIAGSGYSFPFTLGAYVLTGNGNFAWGNNCNGVINPSGTTTLTGASMYRTTEPHFWIPGLSWPALGLPNTIGANQIPSETNALSGNFATCNDTLYVTQLTDANMALSVYPNPAQSEVNIFSNKAFSNISIYDMRGKLLYSEELQTETQQAHFRIPEGMHGLVLLKADSQKSIMFIEK